MVIHFDHRHKPLDGDLLLTTQCPVECDFCVYACNIEKDQKKWMPEKTIHRVAEEYSKNDISIRICGGEPFLDLSKLKKCIEILFQYYEPSDLLIITSGFFGNSKKNTLKYLGPLKRLDFDTLVISSDRFHLKRVPLKNIETVVDICKELEIEPILRISIDPESHTLINRLTEMIVKNNIKVEVHSWGSYGKAEEMENFSEISFDKEKKYFFDKIKEYAGKLDLSGEPNYYFAHSSKRSQRRYLGQFYPTTYPNGNLYGCSITLKYSLMGNINNQNLLPMILKWKNTLPGFFHVSKSSCNRLKDFLPPKFNIDRCDFCRNQPFNSEMPEEKLGRLYTILNPENLEEISNKLKKGSNEYLLSFRIKEEQLNNKLIGEKIDKFLNELKKRKIRFTLSRPLPPCISVKVDDKQPKNCFECRELFTIDNRRVRYCEPLNNVNGEILEKLDNRMQIFNKFLYYRAEMKISSVCENCIYRTRKKCNGLCFLKKV
ncbi:hypothetical protein A3K63_03575 [Candidatus Micrarchaeota archaeon RBG_16_49_10]|nr:MAG: hypothetical protein A3K63_03575 [Candidatus Micrarchaeota archaeon RBG_16_49_10]